MKPVNMSKIIVFLSFLASFRPVFAQKTEEILANWSNRSPIEKVYLHFDRDSYLAGETAWFKAYLYSDYFPDTISSNLYAELVNSENKVLLRKLSPVISGTTHGQFELPDSLVSGYYLFRAYTPAMFSKDPQFIFNRKIYIYGRKDKNPSIRVTEKKTRIEFFPEGGNLVQGLTNTIAFKATDENGFPVNIKGNLKNSRNEILTAVQSFHDGMGMFELNPDPGEQYYLSIEEKISATKYFLPASTDKGIGLTIIPHPQGNFFELKQGSDPAFRAAYMIGQMQNQLVFHYAFPADKPESQGVINTQHLHSGILQVTVFNQAGYPLAERLCFVNNKEYMQAAQLVPDTVNFSPRARNRFRLQMKDTIEGSFSISVTDPSYERRDDWGENIISGLLLNSDLPGTIHHPSWYFHSDDDSVKTALDLVMMTNGWRRFKWTELLKNENPGSRIAEPGFIHLSGKAVLRGTKKTFAGKPLLVMINTLDKKRIIQVTQTDQNGEFRIDSLLFFGQAGLLFSDIKGKKSQYIDVLLKEDSAVRAFVVQPTEWTVFDPKNEMMINSMLTMDYEAIQRANGLLLENVTIKAEKKTPLQELEARYTRGAFSSDANRTIDLLNNQETMGYNNIFDYLENHVPGIQVSKEGLDYEIFYRQTATASGLGNPTMTIFLDEIETDPAFIAALPADKVALVKVFGNFIAAAGNAPGGALAIYTKKGEDYINKNGFASYSIYQGYSIIKEFYAPDYQVNKEAKTDHRITIDWRPDILINHINPSVPFSFYNNDRTKKFRIVIEGMTSTGKMISLEKIISE